MRIPVNRPLTPKEYGLLEWLVLNGSPESLDFAPQLPFVSTRGTCSCGCPTVDLMVEESVLSINSTTTLLADFFAQVHGREVGVLLFQRSGRLSMLEIYALGDAPEPFDLPEVPSLVKAEWIAGESESGLKFGVRKV